MTHLPGLEIGLILHERTAVQIKSGIYRLREKGEAVCLSRKNLNDFSFTFTLSKSHQFSSVAQSCLTLCDPMDCSMPGLPVHPQLLELAQTQVHWVSDAIQPPHPQSSLLLLTLIFPSIRVSSNESPLHIRWPKYWSFSFSISPSKEYSELISFRMDWLDSLQSKGLSRVFSNTIVQKYQFFSAQLSLQSNSHIHTWLLEKP